MLGAIYTGLSGMNAYSEGLMMISNDVANLNTLGYKGNYLSFDSLFEHGGSFLGSSSGGNGYGVSMGSSFIDFSQGTLQQTTNPLDLAIQGGGFLTVLKDGKTFYERTGNFFVDKDGNISDTAGNHLAVLDDNNMTAPFNVNGFKTYDPAATTGITFDGTINVNDASAAVQTIKVFDSRGTEHDWTVTFTKISGSSDGDDSGPSADNWSVSVKENGVELTDSENPFKLQFDANGKVTGTSTLAVTEDVDGATSLNVNLDFSAMRALSGASTVEASSVDGNAIGTLTGVGVDADGNIELAYSNGKTLTKGAVALANFQDPQILQRLNGGLYTDPTGKPVSYHKSGEAGVGTLQSGQVEASNVNLSSEFGELILIERGFQACSQIVSISNEMIQTLFGMRGQG
ncbi:MAG TPA: flagellar hook-basal body complex protein [Rhizomicrobium sp.]|nr:flagellar hook-basal body complex protein [Rhizomicrobium sp.]